MCYFSAFRAGPLIASGVLLLLLVAPAQTQAQALPGGPDPAAVDQARRTAEAAEAERQAREAAPQTQLGGSKRGGLGPFPVEADCHRIEHAVPDGDLPRKLHWVTRHLKQFDGRCVGGQGLNYILASLQAAFLDRGLTTTRAGYPQQDLSTGTLRVVIVPGVIAGVRGDRGVASWRHAFPSGEGDLLSLRAMEQGLDQMRRIPGRTVAVDIAPGEAPGESYLDLAVKDGRPLSLSMSINNLAGPTVGRWQGSAQLTGLNLLGLSEIATVSINSRLESPSLPADSRGDGISLSVPFGWWTFGGRLSRSRHSQRVIGEVKDFDTYGHLNTVSAFAERVVHRGRTSKTAVRLSLQRRWGRNYIDGVEIGLQRQDLTDIELAVIDRHHVGRIQIDSEITHRRGVSWFGAQKEPANRPATLPTARYRITSTDIAFNAPLTPIVAWRAAFHAQVSDRPLYGSDQISVGGPFTVRGFDSDQSLIGRSGWYLRQEVSIRVGNHFQPYGFGDAGRVRGDTATLVGVGMGLRAYALGGSIDSWVAIPVSPDRRAGKQLGMIGFTAGWTL